MPDEPDGVYIDDLGTVATTGAATGRSALGVADLLARVAAHGRAEPRPSSPDADTRAAPVPEGVLYGNVDHPTLKAMVTENVDPDQVGALATCWQDAGARLSQFQDDVVGAVNSSRAEWQGVAGEAARQFMIDVGQWIGGAGRGAQLAGTQAARQSEALAAARNAMPEPVAFDVDAANAELRQITDPLQWLTRYAEHMRAYNAQLAAQQRAAEVVATYDAALADSATMPAFAPPPEMAGSTAPLPRTPQDGTVPMSAPRSGAPATPPEDLPRDDAAAPAAAAVPVAGGFAVAPMALAAPRSVEHTGPGAPAAENYMLDGDRVFGTRPTMPPVIGG